MEVLLANLGVWCLPIWADTLPIVIHDDKLDSFSDGLNSLLVSRGEKPATPFGPS
jgi:hypothetical protein